MQKRAFGIAVIGCGTVGGAVSSLLVKDAPLLSKKTGTDLVLKYIVDLDFTYAKTLGLPSAILEKDLKKVLEDPEVDVVVELIGGITTARTVIEDCIKAGKHVVTANKALLAHYGADLIEQAHNNGVTLAFEASCAGGIPVVRALYDGLIANRIDALYGIVNGTCNYILTAMTKNGQSFQDALSAAQRDGLAEADPTLDVSGMDSVHKLAILSSIAFGQKVSMESIPVTGIDTLDIMDVNFGAELGYTLKLLAVAKRTDEGVSLIVHPAFIDRDHPLAWVSGPFNAVSVYASSVGHTMYYGRGAGGSPTASAIVSDIISIALGTLPILFEKLSLWPAGSPPAVQIPREKIISRYYIRLSVEDNPGVFAMIASALGKRGISISSVLQKEPHESEKKGVPVVITTHRASEGELMKALSEIDGFKEVLQKSVCITIIDEHEENLLT